MCTDITHPVDDRLRLVFTCCHPALSLEARVALTLKVVSGLPTGAIARAFLTTEATVGQRLLRAKRRIQNAGIPYRVPTASMLPERLDGVLAVVYLVCPARRAAATGSRRTWRLSTPPRATPPAPTGQRW